MHASVVTPRIPFDQQAQLQNRLTVPASPRSSDKSTERMLPKVKSNTRHFNVSDSSDDEDIRMPTMNNVTGKTSQKIRQIQKYNQRHKSSNDRIELPPKILQRIGAEVDQGVK